MATLSVSPSSGARTGQPLVLTGADFEPSTKVTVTISKLGADGILETDVTSDADGNFSTTDQADPAVATLTSTGVNVSVDDTVTIGAVTYTFKAAPTTVANEVKIGATAAASLANLKKAINLTGVSGTDYGSGTVIHPTVEASTLTATTLLLVAKTWGTGGNSLASTEAAATLSFGGATFSGGAAATGAGVLRFTPNSPGIWSFSATDGTNTATATSQVFVSG